MELNDSNSNGKPVEIRSVPFDIDLNETPLSSPRETVFAVAGSDAALPVSAASERTGGGKGKVVLLDMNALPSEAEREETEEFFSYGIQSVHDTSSVGNSNNATTTCSNLLFMGNQFDPTRAPGNVANIVKSSSVDIVQHRLNFLRTMKEVDPHSVFIGRHWASDYSMNTILFQNQSEKFLQNLREFIFDNHGILEDGWRVEFFYCQNRCKTFAVYCSPDGNKFESMFDVACHLGLVPNYHSMGFLDRNDGFTLAQNRLHLHRRRKESLMLSRTKDLKECQENMKSSFTGKFSLGIETKYAEAPKLRSNITVPQANSEKTGIYGSSRYKDGFPVQFGDFFILSLGKVDPRPSYHCTSQIWPVGYKSCWHDKITGSLFVCDVSDGGDCGPLFKVQRYPCSAQPIPSGSTLLSSPSFGTEDKKSESTFDIDNYEDINVQMIFSDRSPPHLDFNVSTAVGTALDEALNFQPADGLQTNSNCISQSLGRSAPDSKRPVDDIGEFLVEGRSSSSVWRMVSEKLVHHCHEVYKQNGVYKFGCRHAYECWSSFIVRDTVGTLEPTDSLAKFCHISDPFYFPHHVESNDEFASSCEALVKWLGQDRFGLDIDFVQEIIEQLPGIHSCSDYTVLNKRTDKSKLQTVGNGFLSAKRSDDVQAEKETYCKNPKQKLVKGLCPPGKPLGSKLPIVLVGDVLQSWEILWRFSEVLGLEETLSFEELEEELIDCHSLNLRSSYASAVSGTDQDSSNSTEMETFGEATKVRKTSDAHIGCTGETLYKAHCSLLKVLLAELQPKLAFFIDPIFESGEFKSRKKRKKEADNLIFARKSILDLLPINELTWPELARRYLLTISSIESNLDSPEIVSRESCKVFHCLQGDSGAFCGSPPGVALMEADALLLAEATKQIFGTLKNIKDSLKVDFYDSAAPSSSKEVKVNDVEVPEWAKVLEPVRKLPTNVGARIRRCIYDALALNPPEWATKILEHSISKEVYKGNASGPTKKAVLSVLADVCGEIQQQKPNRKRKNKHVSTLSDVIMRQCRKVLRRAAADDEEKIFCNLLGRTLLNTSENDEGLLGFPTMVSRPLDFRTIDLRLAFGAYGGSHEAFLEDVQEVWHHIRTAYADHSDLLHLAKTLSRKFEALYEKEVLTLVQKLTEYTSLECLSPEAKKEMEDILEHASEIPKAPWEEGVCKICGVDKDDDNVLLCDKCDSGYHTYCLNPPLTRIPEGNWYCPSCITQVASQIPQFIGRYRKKRHKGELTSGILESLAHLVTSMEVKDYWECSVEERIVLLKFLGDEVMNSANIREHLDQCASVSGDLQQKLRSLCTEWRNLKFREEVLAEKVAKANASVFNGAGKSRMEGAATNYDKLVGQPLDRNILCSTTDLVHLEDDPQFHRTNDFTKPCWFYPNGSPEQHFTSTGSQFVKIPDCECQLNQPDVNDLQASNQEAILIKNKISVLQDSIACLELQLQKVYMRKECLGNDSAGRFYWNFSRPGSSPWVIVDGVTMVQQKNIVEDHRPLLSDNLTLKSSLTDDLLKFKGINIFSPHVSDLTNGAPVSSQFYSHQSNAEIEELIKWLRDNDPMQKKLIESLLQRLKYGHYNSKKAASRVKEAYQPISLPTYVEKKMKSNALETKALFALEKKYGPCFEQDVTDVLVNWSRNAEVSCGERMFRCECLEPIWPCRDHCYSCHWSFSTRCELKEHNDEKCSSGAHAASQNSKVIDDVSKGKGMMRIEQGECSDKTRQCKSGGAGHEIEFRLAGFSKDFACPYKLEEISAKFITRSSNKELVKEIGFLGSSGIPSLVSLPSPYLGDPTLKLVIPWKNGVSQSDQLATVENGSQQAVQGDMITLKRHVNNSNSTRGCSALDMELEEVGRSGQCWLRYNCSKPGNELSEIRDSSSRPLVGKGAQILKQLKICLLDMDAALPEESLKSSKAYLEKRCSWRAFVKSAKSVFEMVQATIVFENMIKTDFLRNEWWYWSSVSTAAKIATVSALALRIYTLDAAIVYENSFPFSPPKEVAEVGNKSDDNSSAHTDVVNNLMPSSKPAPRTPNLDPTNNSKQQSRSGKKRKDSEG